MGLLVLVSSCKQDDFEKTVQNVDIQHGLKLQRVTYLEFEKNSKLINSLDVFNQYLEIQKGLASKNVYDETYDFTVNTDFATYLNNEEEGYHSYTFPIHRRNSDSLEVENLVLMSTDGGETYKDFIVKYNLTAEQYSDIEHYLSPTDTIVSVFTEININESNYQEKVQFNEDSGCWESITTYHSNSDGT